MVTSQHRDARRRIRDRVGGVPTPWRAPAVSLAVVAALLVLPGTGLGPHAHFDVRPEIAKAIRTGKPVEIDSERTPTQRMWANPDATFDREISAVPVRALIGKTWKPIDLDLVRRSDGHLTPKASANTIVLSGGGTTPLLRTKIGGVDVTTNWPAALPVPSIAGPTATYADVFKGVDLKMTVTDTGTSQVLVVKDRKAALNPALGELRMRTTAKGGTVRAADGGFEILDRQGRRLAAAPQPLMWDSSGVVRDDNHHVVKAGTREASVLRSVTPADGDAVVNVRTTLARHDLVLHPDTDVLAAKSVAYPVFIDPEVEASENQWAMVRQQSPSTKFYNWTTSGGQGAGYDGGYLQRLFWELDTSSLIHATISRATFSIRETWTPACTEWGMELWRTLSISSTTTWNTQPHWEDLLDNQQDSAGHPSCNPYGRTMEFNALAGVTFAAAGSDSHLTLGLRAHTESNSSTWKQFQDHNVTLRVTYSFPPDAPSLLSLADPLVPCTTPIPVIGGVKPRVSAQLTDADHDNVIAQFEAFSGTTATGTSMWSENTAPGANSDTRFTSNTRIQKSDGTLPDGTYTWHVRAAEASGFGLVGPWSAPCTFTVDNSLVAKPGLVVPGGTAWNIDGDPTTVTLTPSEIPPYTVPANFSYYRWSLNSSAPTSTNLVPTATNRQQTITVSPNRAGVNILRVWAYSAAGNVSAPYAYTFDTNATNSAFASRYFFDEPITSTSVSDQAGTHPLTVLAGTLASRGTYRVEGSGGSPSTEVHDGRLLLAGSEATPALSAGTAVSTDQSFTVSAWVDPTNLTGDHVAVSEGGSTGSNFTLGISDTCGASPNVHACYRFGFRNGAGSMVYAESTRLPSQDSAAGLVHIVGDISKTGIGRIRVIVDGNIEENRTAMTAPTVASSGPLMIGASGTTSAYSNKWVGSIDNVMVMQGLLDDAALVQLDATDAGRCYVDRYDSGLTACAH